MRSGKKTNAISFAFLAMKIIKKISNEIFVGFGFAIKVSPECNLLDMKYINKINKANKGSKENRSALYLQLGVPLL